jgi:hypothetical protein
MELMTIIKAINILNKYIVDGKILLKDLDNLDVMIAANYLKDKLEDIAVKNGKLITKD